MATFFVIPPRECLEQAVAEFLGRVLPGLPAEPTVTDSLLAAVEFEANRAGDVYLVHREDLPGSRDVVNDLIDAFGAERGDTVVEIGNSSAGRMANVRKCQVLGRMSETHSAR
jgi:hypothetical protein